MKEFFKRLLASAGIGFLLGGPVGAIIGAVFAGGVSSAEDILGGGGEAEKDRALFTTNLIVLMTLVAKADDNIAPEEARAIANFFKQHLNFREEQLAAVRKIMKETLRQNPSPYQVAQQFSRASRKEERLNLLRLIWMIAGADGPVNEREKDVIDEIAKGFGVNQHEQTTAGSEFLGNRKDHYKTLGLKKSASNEEVKATYRKLAKQYHPDRVSHLGDDFKKLAHEKFSQINEAYEAICKERGI